jgi:hypothetical protein
MDSLVNKEFSDSLDSLQLSCGGYNITAKASEDMTEQEEDLDQFVQRAIGQYVAEQDSVKITHEY